MSIASRIEAIEQHLTDDYNVLEVAGADLTNVDKNILNLKTTWQERLLYFMNNGTQEVWDNWEKVVGEGTTITLNNTEEAPMKIVLKGNTSQESTTQSANLFDEEYYNNDSLYSINAYKNTKLTRIKERGTLYFKAQLKTGKSEIGSFYLCLSNKQNPNTMPNNTAWAIYGTIVADGSTIKRNYATFDTSDDLYFTFYPATVAVDTIFDTYDFLISTNNISYVPFVPNSPSPDYPQDIHVVSGDNSIDVCGKNLALTDWASDFVSRVNDSSKASLVIEDNRNCVFFLRNTGYGEYDTKYFFKTNWKENTQYTVSFYIKPTATQSNLSFLYTDGTNKTLADNLIANVWQKLTVTSLANKTLERIQGYWASGEDYVDIDTFMVEEGTTATTYEEYKSASYPINLGDIELCKIGDYQDYIYKEGKKWYKYKAIGNYEFTGNESWTYYSDIAGSNLFRMSFTNYARNIVCYSNCYKGIAGTRGRENFNIYMIGQVGSNNLDVLDNRFTSASAFNTWLGSNNVIVYYVLNTPTTTEITDATLISQLEAIKEAESYSGQTNISQTNDDKPFIINASALEEMS